MAEKMPVYWGTGRRKTSVARVRIRNGAGDVKVNDRTIEDYFPRETSRMVVHQPFDVTHTRGTYDVIVKVGGGGVSAQAEAVRLGIARALLEVSPDLRPSLKKAGLLTRDARAVERKKYGRHKARKRPQYSKR